MSSFVGAIAIADLVKTTLGPKGMDKILQSVSSMFYVFIYFGMVCNSNYVLLLLGRRSKQHQNHHHKRWCHHFT
jgi:hypothetical protein